MPVSLADIQLIRDSRLPVADFIKSFPSEERIDIALTALPLFTSIFEVNAPSFSSKILEVSRKGRSDILLSMIRDSFTEFRYDDFSQLEGHYHDVLALMATFLMPILEQESESPDFIEWILKSEDIPLHICFNLRGSAEDAASKVSLTHPGVTKRVGVSFSAFDRTIDRWCHI